MTNKNELYQDLSGTSKITKVLILNSYRDLEALSVDDDSDIHYSNYFNDNGGDTDGNVYLIDVDDLDMQQAATLRANGADLAYAYVVEYDYNETDDIDNPDLARFNDAGVTWCGWQITDTALVVIDDADEFLATLPENYEVSDYGNAFTDTDWHKAASDTAAHVKDDTAVWIAGAYEGVLSDEQVMELFVHSEHFGDAIAKLDTRVGYWMLEQVVTNAEVAALTNKPEITIRQALNRGNYYEPARQSGSTWLLLRRDALPRFGKVRFSVVVNDIEETTEFPERLDLTDAIEDEA